MLEFVAVGIVLPEKAGIVFTISAAFVVADMSNSSDPITVTGVGAWNPSLTIREPVTTIDSMSPCACACTVPEIDRPDTVITETVPSASLFNLLAFIFVPLL